MGCLDPHVRQATIVQGADYALPILLESGNETAPYFDLAGATEIEAIFAAANTPGYLEKKLSLTQIVIVSAPAGSIQVILSPTDTNALMIGQNLKIEVRVTIAGKITTFQLLGVLNVVASLFPTAT